jgi:hypothetical protein
MFVIAIDAVNYKEINPNSIDLSNAISDNLYNSNMSDTDNPDVPNMENFMGLIWLSIIAVSEVMC